MDRYNKYLVIKNSDIASFLNDYQKQTLEHLTNIIQNGRLSKGKAPQSYVCVAADWPMYEQVWSMVESFVDGKPNEIEQLTARVRELEEFKANVVKECASIIKHAHKDIAKQLAASQAYAEQLRKALNAWIGIASNCSIESGVCCCGEAMKNHSSPMACGHSPVDMADSVVHSAIQKTDKALALPRDTSALDAYVTAKVKEARPDFNQMREMLRAMQAGELTVSRGIEILDMWHAGNWNDNMLPPVRQDLIEEDSMPVEIIDRCNQQITTLTRQRDLAVEALEKSKESLGTVIDVRNAEDWPKLHHTQMLVLQAISTIKESEVK